jgi:hypothetical protein
MTALTGLTALLFTATGCYWGPSCGGRSNDVPSCDPVEDAVPGFYTARECSETSCLEAEVDLRLDSVEMVVTDDDGNTWLVTWPREGLTTPR